MLCLLAITPLYAYKLNQWAIAIVEYPSDTKVGGITLHAITMTSWWADSVSNHQLHDCLLNLLFRRRSKKTSKLCVTGLCAGNSPETGEFPAKWPVTRKMFPFDDVIMITYFSVGISTDFVKFASLTWSWAHVLETYEYSSILRINKQARRCILSISWYHVLAINIISRPTCDLFQLILLFI